jgi:hypothetical protein
MQAKRFWALTHCILLLSSSAFLCCGSEEATTPDPAAGTSGGAHEPVGGEGSGTPDAGNDAGGGPSNGGASAPIGGASAPIGGAGATSPGGATDGGAAINGGAGAGSGQPPVEQLSLCARVTQRNTHAFNVAVNYDHAVYEDCRTTWVTSLYLDVGKRDVFLNTLQHWNLAFWGCSDEPVASFALIYGTAPLTAGDATALIEKYMAVATLELELSPAEITEMQSALERLSQQVIADPSTELSGADCDANAGGAGGTSEPGAAGHGGTP